ncbi:MAG: hypothetical protein KDK65_05025 [Chlamydiia bacterium]|nr:hypothetical protein [Chlamydiia bacterium]
MNVDPIRFCQKYEKHINGVVPRQRRKRWIPKIVQRQWKRVIGYYYRLTCSSKKMSNTFVAKLKPRSLICLNRTQLRAIQNTLNQKQVRKLNQAQVNDLIDSTQNTKSWVAHLRLPTVFALKKHCEASKLWPHLSSRQRLALIL